MSRDRTPPRASSARSERQRPLLHLAPYLCPHCRRGFPGAALDPHTGRVPGHTYREQTCPGSLSRPVRAAEQAPPKEPS